MRQAPIDPQDALFARLSRFALCIAPDSGAAYDALLAMTPLEQDEGLGGDNHAGAFTRLLFELEQGEAMSAHLSGQPPRSLVARFSCLPYQERVAFALVVIEEFTVEDAAQIMGVADGEVRNLLLACRDFLFSSQWSVTSDA